MSRTSCDSGRVLSEFVVAVLVAGMLLTGLVALQGEFFKVQALVFGEPTGPVAVFFDFMDGTLGTVRSADVLVDPYGRGTNSEIRFSWPDFESGEIVRRLEVVLRGGTVQGVDSRLDAATGGFVTQEKTLLRDVGSLSFELDETGGLLWVVLTCKGKGPFSRPFALLR